MFAQKAIASESAGFSGSGHTISGTSLMLPESSAMDFSALWTLMGGCIQCTSVCDSHRGFHFILWRFTSLTCSLRPTFIGNFTSLGVTFNWINIIPFLFPKYTICWELQLTEINHCGKDGLLQESMDTTDNEIYHKVR